MDRDSKFVWIGRLIEVCNKMIPEMFPEILKNFLICAIIIYVRCILIKSRDAYHADTTYAIVP